MIKAVYTLYRYRCDVPSCTAEAETEYDSRPMDEEPRLPRLPPGWVRTSRYHNREAGGLLVFCQGHELEELADLLFEPVPKTDGGRTLYLTKIEHEVLVYCLESIVPMRKFDSDVRDLLLRLRSQP